MSGFLKELRLSLRSLARQPGPTALAVLVFGLGGVALLMASIGLNGVVTLTVGRRTRLLILATAGLVSREASRPIRSNVGSPA